MRQTKMAPREHEHVCARVRACDRANDAHVCFHARSQHARLLLAAAALHSLVHARLRPPAHAESTKTGRAHARARAAPWGQHLRLCVSSDSLPLAQSRRQRMRAAHRNTRGQQAGSGRDGTTCCQRRVVGASREGGRGSWCAAPWMRQPPGRFRTRARSGLLRSAPRPLTNRRTTCSPGDAHGRVWNALVVRHGQRARTRIAPCTAPWREKRGTAGGRGDSREARPALGHSGVHTYTCTYVHTYTCT